MNGADAPNSGNVQPEPDESSQPLESEDVSQNTLRLSDYRESYLVALVTLDRGQPRGSEVKMTDEELAAAAAAGDDQAFTILFSRHHDNLIRQSRRRLSGDWNAAQEIAQATWLKVHLNLGSFNPEIRPFVSWLHCIRLRLLIDYVRARRAGAFIEFADDLTALPADAPTDGPESLAYALDELPANLREAVQATYLEERSFPDAARVLGCSVGCVHRRTVHAIKLLREMLGARSNAAVKRLVQVKRRRRRTAKPVSAGIPTHDEIQMLVA